MQIRNKRNYTREPEIKRINGFFDQSDKSQPNSPSKSSKLAAVEEVPMQQIVISIMPEDKSTNNNQLVQDRTTTPKKIRDEGETQDMDANKLEPQRSLRKSNDKQDVQKKHLEQEAQNDGKALKSHNDNVSKKEQKRLKTKESNQQRKQERDQQAKASYKSGQQQQQQDRKDNKMKKEQHYSQPLSQISTPTFLNIYEDLPKVEDKKLQDLLDNHKMSSIISGQVLVQVAKLGRFMMDNEMRNSLEIVKSMLSVLYMVVEKYDAHGETNEVLLNGILHHINIVVDFVSKCYPLSIAQGNAVRGLKKLLARLQMELKNQNFNNPNGLEGSKGGSNIKGSDGNHNNNNSKSTNNKFDVKYLNAKSVEDIAFIKKSAVSINKQYSVGYKDWHVTNENMYKQIIKNYIQSYIEVKIDISGSNIIQKAVQKLQPNDEVMIYGYDKNIIQILKLAFLEDKNITAVVVDGQPHMTGRRAVRELLQTGIHCKYVYITGIQMVIRLTTKVLLQAESVGSNGSVVGLSGTAQLAMQAARNLIPVIVCSESCRFSERKFLNPMSYNIVTPYNQTQAQHNNGNTGNQASQSIDRLDFLLDLTDSQKITTIITEEECYAPITLSSIIQEGEDYEY